MTLRKFRKILLWFFLSLLFLIIAGWIFIETPFGQNWITKKITQRFSKDLNTRIEIKHVSFALFNKMNLQGLIIEDHQQDTLLYAGEATIRITDWFFFKDNIELKYIGLKDAVINLQRKDSTWNYQFLVDYFSSPSTGKKSDGTELNLKKIEFENILIQKKDEWLGQNIVVGVSSLDLDANSINFSSKKVDITSLTIEDPFFSLFNYASLKPSSPQQKEPGETTTTVDSLLKWNSAGWLVNIKKLELKNGILKVDKYSERPVLASFDSKHIEFGNINADFTNLKWVKDSITAQLVLQTKERSGFEVKNMEATIKMTPQEMEFAKLDITTNNSRIRNYFRMNYDDFSDMDDFIHKVKMHGEFDGSEIDSDDIAYFAPTLSTWKKNITLKGTIRGAVDDLVGKNLLIQAGKNTLLNGDITMTGLPDIEKTFIDFKANDFRTTYTDAVAFIPAVRRITIPDLRQLQYIRFNGSFTGFVRDFVTFGTIQTNLGVIKSDLNMKLPAGQPPIYSGAISTDNFRLGSFINDPDIGSVSLSGSVKGRGFSETERKVTMDGKIRYVDYNGYRYTNIAINGNLDKKRFEGIASINDPEAEFTLNGLIDLNNKTPAFNFFADVKKANLKQLNLTKDSIDFKGKFNLNFTGDNIDNFMGYANITDASIVRNGKRLPFDSLILSSQYIENVKKITVISNEFEGNITGNFSIRELPDAFRLFLHKYYPSYIKPPKNIPENQSLTFDIVTQNAEDYIQLIDSSLSGFNYSHIYGSLDTRNSKLDLTATIPQFKYKKYNFYDINVDAKGNNDSLTVSGTASNINVSDSLNFPVAVFNISAKDDRSKVQITTEANQTINKASINAEVTTYNDGVKIEFNPSSFVLNGKTWTIDENGEVEFRRDIPAIGELVLREGNQEIRVRSVPSEKGSWNDLVVDLKKINLGDFAPLFLPKNRLEGLVSGNLLVEDPTNNLYISSDNINVEGLRFDNDSIGEVKATASFNGKTSQLKVNGKTVNEENNLTFNMDLFLADPEKQKNNLIAIQAKTYPLNILQRFIGTLFSDIQGYVTGNFDIKGEFDKLSVTGKGRLQNAGLKVNFTQCFYKIEDTEIELKTNEIDLDGIVLQDPVTGNPVYLTGGIEHNAFKNMFFDLVVSTRKPRTTRAEDNRPVLLLNTSYNDNEQFYGRVKGTGSFSLSGPESDMFMKIDAIASTTDSSLVTIPSSKSRESGIADFLVEKKYGHEMEETVLKSASNIIYDLDVTANPMVTVRVILDELTGDEIKGKGSGSLNIHAGTNENMTIRGRFDIEEGDYLFTFQSFFKKPFKLRKGADNYISWTGDPNSAKIQFEAVYVAENVSFAPLATALSTDPSISKLREDVYVIVNLSGDLYKPDFKFGLEFPPNSAVHNDFSIITNIQQIEKDDNQINRQVTYLIVFNSFAPLETTQSATAGFGSTINELTYSTISSLSGLFFNEINKKLNSELARILKSDNISVNFSGSVYNRNLLDQQANPGFNINQSSLGVNVPISMFKDRFIITLGSTLDVPLQSTIQQNVQFLPDVTAEWLINPSGSIRATFFYEENLDYLITTNTTGAARTKRSGVGIAYRKEFDSLSDFFGGKKKKKQQTPPPSVEEKPKESGSN